MPQTHSIPAFLDIPILPMADTVLLAGATLELPHIYDPRSREAVQSAMNGDRLLGISLRRPCLIMMHQTFGVGRIIEYRPYKKECYEWIDIVLEGRYTVKLISLHKFERFRVGHVEVRPDLEIGDRWDECTATLSEVTQVCGQLAEQQPESQVGILAALTAPTPGDIANRLAKLLLIETYACQSILECNDPLRRLKLVLVQARRLVGPPDRSPTNEDENPAY